MRYLIGLLLYLLTISGFTDDQPQERLILSTPDQLAALTSEPRYLVGGLVSPMGGQLSLRQIDLIVKGAQNITLSRVYIPPYMPCSFAQHERSQEEYDKKYLSSHLANSYKGWKFFPHLRLQFNPRYMEVRLSESNGSTFDFRILGSKTILASPSYAISNIVGDEPNGKYDLRNLRISFEDNGNKIVVHAPDGTVRHYNKNRLITTASYLYLLQKEVLPNGKVLRYHYDNQTQLTCIESLDPQERHVYASLRVSGSLEEGCFHFISSTRMSADYGYQRRSLHVNIKEKVKGGYKKEEFDVDCPPILTSVSSPFYRHENLDYCSRFLLSSYSGKDHIFTAQYAGFDNGSHYRVHKLFLPVGENDSFQPVYEIDYHPAVAGERGGSTYVKNSDGTSIVYQFSKNLLTTSVQYFGQDGGLKKEKIFSWDDNNWLKSIEMKDGQKNLLYKKSYEFDPFGNPILEVFSGDLTGKSVQESYTIQKEFSQDGRNLLLKEEHEKGKVICFSYLPHTNLVTEKLTKDHDRVLLREFSKYDDCHNLIQTVLDDGEGANESDLSGVTQRTITTYILRQEPPFLHMPEWIEEKYLEEEKEKLLNCKHLTYDQYGNVAQEEIYDANGHLAYTIYKDYNERGDLLSETNPLEQKATYGYDSRGHRNFASNFSGRMQKTMRYDAKERLRELRETGDDGVTHATLSDYDFHDRLIQETDHFFNPTRYTYDPLVSQIVKTDFPPVASLNGQPLTVTTFSKYDPFGRKLTQTDANGNTIAYRYNAYGSPVEINYPNGGREYFLYKKDGMLASHTDQDGLTVLYTHDVLGRVLSKSYISAKRERLAEETFTYNGFNLLTTTDKEKNVTKYDYDGAGRKVKEDVSGHITDFSYDVLGRLSTICKHNGDNTLFIHYKKDLEGHLLEEWKSDASGQLLYKISYTYDEDGNEATVTRYINGKKAVDTFAYDSFGRLVQHRDPNSNVTGRSYDENHINQLGQKVLQTNLTDPRNIMTLETKDAFDRIVKKEVLNPQGTTLSCGEMIYDPHGNLTYQIDHVHENGQHKSTQTIGYTYTPIHQIESLTKAVGTKDANTTVYTYFHSGKVQTKTLPDGVILLYEYHPLGLLKHTSSSDRKILHTFEYDRMGYLKYASDERQNISIERKVDPFGNVKQETFPCGLRIDKEYDDFNRIVALRITGNGDVSYSYDPLFLREVTRLSRNGEVLYIHRYEDYDMNGNLTTERLIGNLGKITHRTDPNGQKVSISSPYFSQNLSYDAVGNLISNVTNQIEYRYAYDDLSQLSSENSPHQTSTYTHDSLYNRTKRDGETSIINDLNQLLSFGRSSCSYDPNGNQTLKQTPSEVFHLTYDPLNRLVQAISQKKKIDFLYDPLGRLLSKITYTATSTGWKELENEHYLYHGQNEIGAFATNKKPKNLRVLGMDKNNNPSTIGIELGGQIFAPILDVQSNVRGLIDLESRSVVCSYEFTAFGEEVQKTKESLCNPWRFASKRLDPELGLIYFGKRYYDPEFARWLSMDPAGSIDSTNLYQYVFNNPFRYRDPDGQFAFAIPLLIWGAELVLPSLTACVAPMVYGAITGAVAYGGYKAVQAFKDRDHDSYSPAADYANYVSETNVDCKEEKKKKYNTNPFDGSVSEDVVVVDEAGNAIKVPQGNWLTGSKDGKWIQEMQPGKTPDGQATGIRKDGGHPPGPKHSDPRSLEPHSHIPGVSNSDGTPWLPVKK